MRGFPTAGWQWSSARLRGRRGVSPELVRGAARLVGGDGFEDLVGGRRMVERAELRQGFARGHLFGGPLCPSLSFAPNVIPKGDLGGVLTAVAGTRGADDLILRRRQKALLGDLLQAAFVVVVGPGLHIDQASAEEPVGGPVALVEEDRADDGFEGVGEDRLQRTRPRLVRPLPQ